MSLSARASSAPPSSNTAIKARRFMSISIAAAKRAAAIGRTDAPVQMESMTNWKRGAAIAAASTRRPTPATLRSRLRRDLPRGDQLLRPGANPGPEVTRTEEPAERAGFDPQRIRAPHDHRPVISRAAVPAKDIAGPFGGSHRLHVDQH